MPRHPSFRHASLALAGLVLICVFAIAAASSMDDRFDGTALDTCRWDEQSYFGTVAQDGALVMTTPGLAAIETARVLSQARLTGDFDIQVDYMRVAGFAGVPSSVDGNFPQLRLSLGLWWDESRYIQFARIRHANGDALNVFSSVPGYSSDAVPWIDTAADSGKLRIVREGTRLRFLHSTGGSFVEIGAMNAPATPVFAYLDTANVPVVRALTVRFDNFLVNAGASDDIAWTPPTTFMKRPAFALGGVSENWPAFRYFGNTQASFDAFTLFRQNGMEWMRVGVTTQSHPELDATPVEQWRTLPFKDGYWGSREYAARTLRDAQERGMRLFAYLYFSDQAANWGNQKAPDAWAGKSVAETAALMEQHAYDTAMYFKSKGLDVEIYELGNETDIGMVDFLPNRRIAVPPGVNFVNDRTWLRENVWSVQAVLLKAAAAGIRRATPTARIAVHAASLESGTGQQMGPDFFRAMRDFGVDYDIAAISHPYAQGSRAWPLSRYNTACWQKRFARIVDQIAVPGKPVMMVEASYQSSPETLVSAPMPDFSFTPEGQAAFARAMFSFATNHPSIVGWFWFYPEFQGGITSADNEGYVLQFGSLLTPSLEARPALAEFRPNLGPPSANTVEYYHAAFGHHFISANAAEIAALDDGAFGGTWVRTGQSFMSHAQPAVGTVPVCRFFSTSFAPKSSHFYTADAAECQKLKSNPDWQFEAVAFHAPLPDVGGGCPAGSDPVYRLYNNGTTGAPNHRFTTDRATRDEYVANRGYVSEGAGPLGVGLCAPR